MPGTGRGYYQSGDVSADGHWAIKGIVPDVNHDEGLQ